MSAATRETRIAFQSPAGDQLSGILTEPQDSSSTSETIKSFESHHCAILCHGFASHKQGFHFPAIATHLANELGMSSLRFDYAGNMNSTGEFKFGGYMKEIEQMAAAKAYLEQHHSKQVILLLGHSRGAINATLYSAKYGNIPMVVLVAGRYDLTLNMTQRYGPHVMQQLQATGPWKQVSRRDGDDFEIHWTLTAEELKERFSLDMPAACCMISQQKPQPPAVLVVHGLDDPICQVSDAEDLARSIKGATLLTIPGADHWFKGRLQQLLDGIGKFVVQAWLDRSAAAAATAGEASLLVI